MHDMTQTLTAGTLLIIETGEYSDSSWSGPVRIVRDVVKADLVEAFKRTWTPSYEGEIGPDPHDFLPWLVKEGHAEAVENVEAWHVGRYGEFCP